MHNILRNQRLFKSDFGAWQVMAALVTVLEVALVIEKSDTQR
jgi:hypothetical protein